MRRLRSIRNLGRLEGTDILFAPKGAGLSERKASMEHCSSSTPATKITATDEVVLRDVISAEVGMAVDLEGDAFTEPVSPHY